MTPEEQNIISEKLQSLRGLYLEHPVLKEGIWVFGGGLRRPKLLVEVGSYWRWTSYGDTVFDSLNLSQTSATSQLLPYESEDFQIESFSRNPGEYLHIRTGPHCELQVAPADFFDPSGHANSPLKVRIIQEGVILWEDWTD
jgi:hypothetical protein